MELEVGHPCAAHADRSGSVDGHHGRQGFYVTLYEEGGLAFRIHFLDEKDAEDLAYAIAERNGLVFPAGPTAPVTGRADRDREEGLKRQERLHRPLDDVKPGKTLISLEENNRAKMALRSGVSTKCKGNGIACPNCGKELVDTTPGFPLMSDPPRYPAHCPHCSWRGERL